MTHLSLFADSAPVRTVGKFNLFQEWCPHTNLPGFLGIAGDEYAYAITDMGSPNVYRCYRLTKLNGKPSQPVGSHTCTILRDGSEDCTCGSFIYGTGLMDGRCKHLAAIHHLLSVGDRQNDPEFPGLPEGEDPFAGIVLDNVSGWFPNDLEAIEPNYLDESAKAGWMVATDEELAEMDEADRERASKASMIDRCVDAEILAWQEQCDRDAAEAESEVA
jgi:hypothetical protein